MEADLIDIEDPVEIKKRETINRIKDLCNVPFLPNSSLFSQLRIGLPSSSSHALSHSYSTSAIQHYSNNTRSIKESSVSTLPSSSQIKTGPIRSFSNDFSSNSVSVDEFDPIIQQQGLLKYKKEPAIQKEIVQKTLSEPLKEVKENRGKKDGQFDITFDDLLYKKEPVHGFSKDCTKLQQFCEGLTVTEVQFLAPAKDYQTIVADCIKLIVFIDKSCNLESSSKLEFTCMATSTVAEIMTEILLQVLPESSLNLSDGNIPIDEYSLRVFGVEQVFPLDQVIGTFVYVGWALSHDQDVQLELVPSRVNGTSNSITSSPLLKWEPSSICYDHFDSFVSTLKRNINMFKAEDSEKIAKHNIIQSLKLIQAYTSYCQSAAFFENLELFQAASIPSLAKYALDQVVIELIRFFQIYCSSSPTDFSIISPNFDNNSKLSKELITCSEMKVEVIIDSLHNIPLDWLNRFASFQVDNELVFGVSGLGTQKTSSRTVAKMTDKTINFTDLIVFDSSLTKLPREVHASFVIIGEYKHDFSASNAEQPSTTCLASGTIPLFNKDGLLVQGPVLLGLSQLSNNVSHPWGPRTLIRRQEDPVLRVTFMEHSFDVQYPRDIAYNKINWQPFESMSKADKEFANRIIENSSFHLISKDEKDFLWSKRCYLRENPVALPLILNSCFSWDSISVGHIYALLDDWTSLPAEIALELLLPYFADQRIRSKAVEWIRQASPMFMTSCISQFVEALQFEIYEDSDLAKFLLERCVQDRAFAFEFYWQLQQRFDSVTNSSFRARCRFLQEQIVNLSISNFSEDVRQQQLFLKKIEVLNEKVKSTPDASMEIVLRQGLRELEEIDISRLRIPLNPAFQCKSIKVDSCTYFNSLTKPLKLVFEGEKVDYGVIFKAGDDLRQDSTVLQLVRVMDDIWHKNKLDLRLILFKCLPLGNVKGFIELVPSCRTLREIQGLSGATGVFKDNVLNTWIQASNPSEFKYRSALENFRRSCAGWCVATYILGIGDRHNDNILITSNGHVFHIDFGKYMGNWQMAGSIKRDRVPFILTPEMVYVINQGKLVSTEHFQKFIDECCQAFNLVRKFSSLLLTTMRFMCCSDIPGLDDSAQQFVENNLFLHLNDVDATITFTKMIQESLNSVFPRLNFFAHTLAQLKINPSIAAVLGGVTDDYHMSFINGVYSPEQDGRILRVVVSSYEKWRSPDKIYMFKCLIKRENVAVNSQVYRSYDEFNELQLKLRCKFPWTGFPSLGRGFVVGRTNIQSVAAVRQIELQQFVQMLFDLPDEIKHCDLVYTFFHTIFRDEAPEEHRDKLTRDDISESNGKPQLFLRLSMDFNKQKLSIFVGHARRVPLVNKFQEPDTYAKAYLRRPYMVSDKGYKRKTAVVLKSNNPTYNSELTYTLSPDDLERWSDAVLEVSIWYSSYLLKDNFRLCAVVIPMNCFSKDKDSVQSFEKWYQLDVAQ